MSCPDIASCGEKLSFAPQICGDLPECCSIQAGEWVEAQGLPTPSCIPLAQHKSRLAGGRRTYMRNCLMF